MIRCGIYLRLSREDGEEESNSIGSQRMLLEKYVDGQKDMELVAEWSDDGFSGSDFERPGFQQMLAAAVNREIDCLLCKDLSRLGREYIQTGRLLQEIFPKIGLRFIAVADRYDSGRVDFMEQSLLVPVMNLMNDAYCRDISNKVRWQQRTKRSMGEYIGAFACYGYQKSGQDHHVLETDERVSETVQTIFWLRTSGMSAEGIARVLDQAGTASPRAYKRQQGSRYASGFDGKGEERWSPLAVRRILSNRMYTGTMIQGKDYKISYKLKARKKLPEEKWTKVPDKVPVLVPEWLAELTDGLNRKKVRCRPGRLFCGMFDGFGLDASGKEICEKAVRAWLWEKLYGREEDFLRENFLWRMLLVLTLREIRIENGRIFVRICGK